MEILLRKYCDEVYVWKEAEYINAAFMINGFPIDQTNIISVKNDDRNKYVICGNCGEMIKNTQSAIDAHLKKRAKEKDCASCKEIKLPHRDATKSKLIFDQEENKVKISYEYNFDPDDIKCRLSGAYSWATQYKSIFDPEIETYCKYTKCKTSAKRKIMDFFINYPEAFDVIITVDRLIECGWEYYYENGEEYIYNGGYRDSLFAVINKYGYVDHFYVTHKGSKYVCYYSKKYEMVVWQRYSEYKDTPPIEVMSESKLNSIIKRISKLYENMEINNLEESTNE